MNALDPDIADLFEAEGTPPRDPVFVARVTRRIGLLSAIPTVFAASATLSVALCAVFAGPPLMDSLDALSALFAPILASPWTATGLGIAAAAVAGTFYALQRVRLSERP